MIIFVLTGGKDMKEGNYQVNLDDIIDYLSISDLKGEYVNYWFGIDDDRANDIADLAYHIVQEEIKKGINIARTIRTLLKEAKQRQYNGTDFIFFMYWGMGEIRSYEDFPIIDLSFTENDDFSEN